MSYQLKSGFSLFLKNAALCLFLALSLGIVVSALSSATQAFLRAYQDQERLGDYSPKNAVRFRTAVTGLDLEDEMAFRRSFFPLFEKNAVSTRQYMTLLKESETEYLITGDERLLPKQMRGVEDIRIYYNASTPPPFETVEFLGKIIALQPVDERELFFLSSYMYNPRKKILCISMCARHYLLTLDIRKDCSVPEISRYTKNLSVLHES